MCLLFMLSFAVRPAAAQVFSLGAKGGVGFTTLSEVGELTGQGGDTAQMGTCPVIGAFASVDNTNGIDFQAELLFVEKRVSIENSVGDATGVRLRYLELPLFAKLSHPFTGGNRSVYVLAGPNFGYKLTASILTDDADVDLGEDAARFEVGVAAGIGMEMGRWHVEGRFTQGLTNISTDDDEYTRSRTIAVLAGIRF